MRSLQFYIINALTLLIGLGLMSGSFSSRDAQAARKDSIPHIQVQRLSPFKGQYLSVFYASGTKPLLSSSADAIRISQVKTARTSMITSDLADIPEVELARIGYQPAYNLLVLVVSPNPDFSWQNADHSRPEGMIPSEHHGASQMRVFTRTQVEALQNSQGLESGLVLTL